MHVGDEFFLTLLNAKPNQDYMLDKTITYDNWEDVQIEVNKLKTQIRELKTKMKYEKNKNLENKISELELKMNDIRKNPKTYTEITPKDIDTVFNSKAFFWRKFPATLSLESYYDSYGALKYAKKRGGRKEKKRKYKTQKNAFKKNKTKRNKYTFKKNKTKRNKYTFKKSTLTMNKNKTLIQLSK
jgi:hypothetical protein